jgi:hypothetical protein
MWKFIFQKTQGNNVLLKLKRDDFLKASFHFKELAKKRLKIPVQLFNL